MSGTSCEWHKYFQTKPSMTLYGTYIESSVEDPLHLGGRVLKFTAAELEKYILHILNASEDKDSLIVKIFQRYPSHLSPPSTVRDVYRAFVAAKVY